MRTALLFFVLGVPVLADEAVGLRIEPEKNAVEFRIGSDLVTRYFIGESVAKPYFWPLLGPGQVPMTRDWPIKKDTPKEATDHPHQKSAWFCHGDVLPFGLKVAPSKDKRIKGVDFWSEIEGHGRIVVTGISIPKLDTLRTSNEWRDAAGLKIMDEVREISLHLVSGGRLLVLNIDLHASVCPIIFGDTKEGSMGVRVSEQIRLQNKGERSQMVNAEGKSGDKDVWGYASDWCDYSGLIDGKHAGIAVFDDKSNSARSCWHARGYGLMAANPFGRKESGFPAKKNTDDLVKLQKGEHLKLRYGIFLHPGDAKAGKVAEAYEQFLKLR